MEEVKGLDEENVEEYLELVCDEGKVVKMPKGLVHMSEYIKKIVDSDASVKVIQINDVIAAHLELVLEWMDYHKKVAPRVVQRPMMTDNLKELVGQWDANFINKSNDIVYCLMVTANFLGVPALVELSCVRIVSLMINKPPHIIKKNLGLPEEFTPEFEAKLKEEYADFL